MELNKIFIFICSILLLINLVSADMDVFDNLNGTGYNATFENFFGKFVGNGSQLIGLTESQITDLQHTTDTNRSDVEINTLIDNRVIQSFIEALGFVIGSHTVDTNRSDADILSVASVYNETNWILNQSYLTSESDPIFTSENSSIWGAINNKLESTDQRYNETDLINAVNTTSNIEGLGFVTGLHTTDTNRTDTEINTLIDNRVVQAFIEALGFVTGAHTIDTNRSNEDILNVASVYNDTVAINTKLDQTDQRYNETSLINSVNTTSNIESLNFVQGAHTTDTNRSDSDILSVASVYNETDLINSVNTTSNIEGLGFTQGAHTVDTNRSDSEINTLIDNRVIQSFVETLGFVTGAHTVDTNRSDSDILSVASVYNDTLRIDAVNTTSNIEGLGFVQGQHTTDTNRTDSDILFVASVYNDTNFILNQNYQNATQVNSSIITKVTQVFMESLGFVTGAHTIDTNRSDADIISVAGVFNDTDLINSVNTTSNIEGLGFATGSHTIDTNRSDSEINTLIDNKVIQSFIEGLGFVTGAHTVDTDTNRSDADILSVANVYNDTDIINTKLDATDQRYNETNLINSVNTTSNIEGLGFTQGPHTTDTNETTRFNNLVGTCSGSDKIIEIQSNGTILCGADQTGSGGGGNPFDQVLNTTSNVTFNKINASDWSNVTITENQISDLSHTTDTNRSDADINTLIDNRVIQSFIESLGFVTGSHTVDTNRSDADILSVASVYNETDWVTAQNYLTSESDPNLWTTGFNNTGDVRWLDDTTIGNCSANNSCGLITYNSETSSWDKDNSDDLTISDLPLANKTMPHCSNITGASYDICAGDGGGAGDGNASSICSGDEMLLGNGTCQATTSIAWEGTDVYFSQVDTVTVLLDYLVSSTHQGDYLDTRDSGWWNLTGASFKVGAGQDVCIDGGNCLSSVGSGGNPFDQSLNTTDNVVFDSVNSSVQYMVENGMINFANASDIDTAWIGEYEDGLWIGGDWIQVSGTLNLWDDIWPMAMFGGEPDIWFHGWFGITQNLTVLNTINTTQLCLSGDCQTSWPSGGDGNASSICAGDTTYLDGEGNCDDISSVYLSNLDSNLAWKNQTNTFTANQNMNSYNITSLDCIVFASGGKICTGT